MFCQKCGKELLPNQTVCSNCGAVQAVPEEPKEKKTEYRKYLENVQKMNVCTLVMHISTILLVIALFFVPMFQYQCDYLVENEQMYPGYCELHHYPEPSGNFSLFDDLQILGDFDNSNFPDIFLSRMFLFFSAIFAIIVLFMAASGINKSKAALRDNEITTLLIYDEMRKTGTATTKKAYNLRDNMVYSFIVVFCGAFFYTILFKIISDDNFYFFKNTEYMKMLYLSGVTWKIIFFIIPMGCYVVANNMKKKEKQMMILDIAKTEYNL